MTGPVCVMKVPGVNRHSVVTHWSLNDISEGRPQHPTMSILKVSVRIYNRHLRT